MLALEGIRVLDFGQAMQAPHAAMMLADMGAEVIKVEPRHGEIGRGIVAATQLGMGGVSVGHRALMLGFNRNKRGLAIDLSKEKGREILVKLIERTDVVIHGYSASKMKKLGLEYEAAIKHNPKVIYARATGYGAKGPEAESPSFDLLAQAVSGLIMQNKATPGGPVQPVQVGVCDVASSIQLAYGIMVALFHRERTGIGQQVETSLLGAALTLQAWEMDIYLNSGELPEKNPRGLGPVTGLYMIFKAKDDWFAITGIPDARWPAFCRAAGIEHLLDNPKFATANDRVINREELVALLDELFLSKPREKWLKMLKGFGLPAMPVNTYVEAATHPQVIANQYIEEFNDPDGSSTKFVSIPVKLSETPGGIRRLDPQIGEHTHDILLEIGYSWEEIANLITEEVVGFAAKD